MTAIALPARAQADRAALLAAGLLWSLGMLITNIQPVVFEALHQSRNLDDGQLGAIGAAFVLGAALTTGAGPFWMPRLNPRWVSVGALIATAVCLLGIAAWAKTDSLVVWWFVVGLVNGFVATPAFAALGDTENPVKTYSLALFAASVLAALASFGLPLLALPLFGGKGVLIAIAALFGLAAPAALAQFDAPHHPLPEALEFLPAKAKHFTSGRRVGKVAATVLAAIAGSIFTGVLMGAIYNFIGSIIASEGLPAQALGPIVALGLVGSLVGSILPSILGERVRPDFAIGFASALMVFCYPAMLSHSIIIFGGGFVLQSMVGTLGYTYYLGLVRQLDVTDRIYIAYPALQAVGIAAVTACSGAVLARFAPSVLFGSAACLIVISGVALFAAEWLSARNVQG